MNFFTYTIQSLHLQPFIQYILFNQCIDPDHKSSVTYFPNNDICLGIIRGKQLVSDENGFSIEPTGKIVNSYLTGIYERPHKLKITGTFDEICLPFSPLGYFQFFRFPLKQYVLQEDVVSEAFGLNASYFFEKVFEENDFQKRGLLIEAFLQNQLLHFKDTFVSSSIHYLQVSKGNITLKELSHKLNCSEKKLQRTYSQCLDIMPKDYAQILKFREALHLMSIQSSDTLTSISYKAGYYDQSHFIRNVNRYTGVSPLELKKAMINLDQKVLFSHA